jgi:hypothetical protein
MVKDARFPCHVSLGTFSSVKQSFDFHTFLQRCSYAAKMPIVGTTVVGATSTLGTATYISTFNPTCVVTRYLPTAQGGPGQWYHSTLLVTPFGTYTVIEDHRVPDLTTVYTPSPSCIDRWMLATEPSDCGDDNPRTANFTVYSVSQVPCANCT